MEGEEAFCLIQVGVFGAEGVGFEAELVADTFQEFFGFLGHVCVV